MTPGRVFYDHDRLPVIDLAVWISLGEGRFIAISWNGELEIIDLTEISEWNLENPALWTELEV